MSDQTLVTAPKKDVTDEGGPRQDAPDLARDLKPEDQRRALAADAEARERVKPDVPVVKLDGAENKAQGDKGVGDKGAGDKGLAPVKKLEGVDLQVAQRVQDMLLRYAYLLPTVERKKDESMEDAGKRADKELLEKKTRIEEERKNGVFGPASQQAYKDFVEKLQMIVPSTVSDMADLHLPIPPGCPMDLPRDKYNFLSSPELFRKQVASGELTCNLNVSFGEKPKYEDLTKLENTLRFQGQSVAWQKEATDRMLDDGMRYLIKSNNLPEKWAKPEGMETEAWRQACQRMTTFSVTARNYIEAGYQLKKSDRYNNFNFELPPGVKITEKDGKIVDIQMDLPEDLRLAHPRNQQKIERLETWLNQYGKEIDKALEQAGKSGIHAWGDDALSPNVQAVFDKEGNLKGLFPSDYKPDAAKGERVLDANLLEYRYDVKKLENGKIEVTQHLQVQNVPWWSYQDLLWWDNVGNKKTTTHTYDQDDFVRIRDGGKMELVKAKDLQYFKNVQASWHYGAKIVTGVLDAAMVVSGTIEFGAGLKAASIAARAAEATGRTAVTFTTRECAIQAGRGLFRAGVGAAGIFNNAWGHHSDVGQAINKARNAYFMLDIARGFVPERAASLVRPARLAEVGKVAEKFETAMKDSKWLFPLPKIAEQGFRWSERGMVPLVGRDVHRVVFEGAPVPHLSYADQLRGDRSLVKLPEKGLFDMGKKENLQATEKLVDGYSSALQDGRPASTSAQIRDIFDTTKRLLKPDAPAAERESFKQDMLKKVVFSEADIQKLEKEHGRKFSDAEFKDLLDPSKRGKFGSAIKNMAASMEKNSNADVKAAAAISLILLSTDKDGKLPATLAASDLHVDRHQYTETVATGEGAATVTHTIDAHDINVKFSPADMVSFLRRDMEVPSKELGNRGIVTGDALMRIGGVSGMEYAAVLQDVLSNPDASRADKMRALSDKTGPRFAEVLDLLGQFEQKLTGAAPDELAKAQALTNEVTSEGMKETLKTLAKDDKDPDVRGMAAAVLFGLGERERVNALTADVAEMRRSNPSVMTEERFAQMKELFSKDKDMQALFLDANHERWEKSAVTPGMYKEQAIASLKEAMNTTIPADCPPEKAYLLRERQLNAALSLSLLSPDAASQKQISQAIASSILSTPDMDKLLKEPSAKDLYNRYLDLASRAAQALYPDRIKQLDGTTPADLRAKLVALVRTPADFNEETRQVALLKQMSDILKDASVDEKKALMGKLQKMIDPAQGADYAGVFPQARAQAITTISEFGNRDALDLIRARSTSMLAMELSNRKTVRPCGEEDARVRLAAVMALEKLTDERMGEIASLLVNNEKDPIVSEKIRAIMSRYENPSKDQQSQYRETYDKKYQETLAKLTRDPRYSVVDAMSNQQIYDWVKDKDSTRLLNMDNWYADRTARAQKIYDDWGNWDWFWSRRKTVVNGMSKGAEASDGERAEVWEKFCRLAKGQSVDGMSPGGLMPDVNLTALKDRLTADLSKEMDDLKKSKESVEKQLSDGKARIDTLKAETESNSGKTLADTQKLQRDIDTARAQVDTQTTAQRTAQGNGQQGAQQLAEAQLELSRNKLEQSTRQLAALQKESAETRQKKQDEIDTLQRRADSLRAQQTQLDRDLRRASALFNQVGEGLNTGNARTQLEIASALAKRQLYLMLCDGAGGLAGRPDQNNPKYGEYKLPVYATTTSVEAWKNEAAKALAECCKPGAVGRGLAVDYVKQLLVTREIPAEARMTLLNAWREVAKPTGKELRDQLSWSEDELAIVTLRALDVELGRAEGEQSKAYQMELLKDLRSYGYRPAFAVLDGMMERPQFSKLDKEVQGEAKKVLQELRDGVSPLWYRTQADAMSDAASRASRLAERTEGFSKYQKSPFADKEVAADQLIQAAFNNYKSYKFKDENDPGVKVLSDLMNCDHQKVRMAAAMMALESSIELPVDSPIRNAALSVLSDSAVRGKCEQYRKEAYDELAWFASKKAKAGDFNAQQEKTFEIGQGAQKRTYVMKKQGDNITVFERANGEVSAIVYPGGRSSLYLKENGTLSVLIENGTAYYRKKDTRGNFTEEWSIDGGSRSWFGTGEFSLDGIYTYRRQSDGKSFRVGHDGVYVELKQ